jgi:hypothetical protein
MDGLSRWDLVMWFVVAYVAVMALVRMMLRQREIVSRKLRDQLAAQQRRKKPTVAATEERREAA